MNPVDVFPSLQISRIRDMSKPNNGATPGQRVYQYVAIKTLGEPIIAGLMEANFVGYDPDSGDYTYRHLTSGHEWRESKCRWFTSAEEALYNILAGVIKSLVRDKVTGSLEVLSRIGLMIQFVQAALNDGALDDATFFPFGRGA